MPTNFVVATQIINITMYRGQTLNLQVQLNPVVNITGWKIAFTMVPTLGAQPELSLTTVGGGITIVNGPGGLLQVNLASANTAALILGNHYYDVSRIDDPPRDPLATGILTLLDIPNRYPA